jgi:hypothetical protein
VGTLPVPTLTVKVGSVSSARFWWRRWLGAAGAARVAQSPAWIVTHDWGFGQVR